MKARRENQRSGWRDTVSLTWMATMASSLITALVNFNYYCNNYVEVIRPGTTWRVNLEISIMLLGFLVLGLAVMYLLVTL
jgi:hypothetical protein